MSFRSSLQLLRPLLGAVLCLGVWAAEFPQDSTPRARWGALRVLHFGDSHTGSDPLQAVLRQGLADRFGDGGSGLGLPWGGRRRDGLGATSGWRRLTVTGKSTDVLVGLGGAALESTRRGERAWLHQPCGRLRLYLLRQPGGGTLRLTVDGRLLGDHNLNGAYPEVVVVDRNLGAASQARRVELQTLSDGKCRILGVALEGFRGAAYSPLSVNGAQASWLLRMPETLFLAQMAPEAPDLIILAFGTNEAIGHDFDPGGYDRALRQVLERCRRAAPQAALLLVAPPDAAFRNGRPGALDQVAAIQRAQAAAFGAGFVDLRQAMGAGAIRSWLASGLAQNDLVHFTPQGYFRHAHVILTAALRCLEAVPRVPGIAPLAAPQGSPIYKSYGPDGTVILSSFPPPGEAPGPRTGSRK